MISDNRMELYQQGLKDAEIAKAVGVTQGAITCWRKYKGLIANRKRERKSVRPGNLYQFKYAGKSMESVLSPDQCEVIRDLFRLLITAADRNPGKVDVSRIINYYRKEYGGETIANNP